MKKQIITIVTGILIAAGIFVSAFFFVKMVIQDHQNIKSIVDYLNGEIAKKNNSVPLSPNSAPTN